MAATWRRAVPNLRMVLRATAVSGGPCCAANVSGGQSSVLEFDGDARCSPVFAHGFYGEGWGIHRGGRCAGGLHAHFTLCWTVAKILQSREVSNMTTPTALGGYSRSGLVWDFMRFGYAGRIASLAAFALLYSALVILGLVLRENSQQLTILWPAA